MLWRDAVIDGLHRFSARHLTNLVDRQSFIAEELDQIIRETDSQGQTPGQTMSRVLQELQQDQLLHFDERGKYLLADKFIDVGQEDLPEDAIDFAIRNNKLLLGETSVDEKPRLVRQRIGRERLRALALDDYGHRCALCEIADNDFLVASHIVRWADDTLLRGNLANVMCLCKLHDPLFECGYFALSDSYEIIKKERLPGKGAVAVLKLTNKIRLPRVNRPLPEFLRKHRIRTGFEAG